MQDTTGEQLLVPESVKLYLSDAAVRFGVDTLLSHKPSTIPTDLTISELKGYYAARAAAELTRYEWAETLFDLWQLVWGRHLSKWPAAPLDQMLDDESAIRPEDCWDSSAFDLRHRRGSLTLATGVEIGPERTLIAIALESRDGSDTFSLDAFRLVEDEDESWDGWLVRSIPYGLQDTGCVLNELLQASAAALQQIEQVAGLD